MSEAIRTVIKVAKTGSNKHWSELLLTFGLLACRVQKTRMLLLDHRGVWPISGRHDSR
jgi:hypothetical protein